jgi:ketosteroid isomerase-like protein
VGAAELVEVITMTIEDHKRTALELFARLSASDSPGVFALMTADVTWRVAGKPELSPVAGVYNAKRLKGLFDHMLAQLENGLHMKVLGMVAEGNTVAVEVESEGDLKNGREYRQQYHFLITFRDSKIAAVREYLDTHHAFDVWVRP